MYTVVYFFPDTVYIRNITQKRKIPKCSNLVCIMTLGYHGNDKNQGSELISVFFTLMSAAFVRSGGA